MSISILSFSHGGQPPRMITGIEMICNTEVENLFLFEDLDQQAIDLLLPLFHKCSCETDEVIFKQGDPAEYLFIVLEGEVSIRFKPEDGDEMVISRIEAGGVFGWSAAFGSEFYTSGAVCEESSQLIRVKGADLKMLCENHPEVGIVIIERLAAVVAERLRNTHAQVVSLLSYGLRTGIKPIGG